MSPKDEAKFLSALFDEEANLANKTMKNNFVIEISNKKKIMAIKIAKIKYNNKKVMKRINELGKK